MELSRILYSLFPELGRAMSSLCVHLPGNIWTVSPFQHWAERPSLLPIWHVSSPPSQQKKKKRKCRSSTLELQINLTLTMNNRKEGGGRRRRNRGWRGRRLIDVGGFVDKVYSAQYREVEWKMVLNASCHNPITRQNFANVELFKTLN